MKKGFAKTMCAESSFLNEATKGKEVASLKENRYILIYFAFCNELIDLLKVLTRFCNDGIIVYIKFFKNVKI